MTGERNDQMCHVRYIGGSGNDRREPVGRSSSGWAATKAHWLLRALKQNIRTGTGPQSIEEWMNTGEITASDVTGVGTCPTGRKLNDYLHHFGIDPAAGRDANMGDESERVCSPFFNFQKQTFRKDVSNRLHLKEKGANEFSLTP